MGGESCSGFGINSCIFCSEVNLRFDFSLQLKACDNRLGKMRMEAKHRATQDELFGLIFRPIDCTTCCFCSSWELSQPLKSPNRL